MAQRLKSGRFTSELVITSFTAAGPSRILTEVPCFWTRTSTQSSTNIRWLPNLAVDPTTVKPGVKTYDIGMNNHCQIVIPARLASSRLPEKLLRSVAGRSVLEHTYHAACQATCTDDVIVAVDDQRLADEVERFGGKWIMTSPTCASGTDRIAEVAASLPEKEVFVNVQGDEPEIDPAVIDQVAQCLIDDCVS